MPSDASGTGNGAKRSRALRRRSATPPDPTCPHCLKRCGSWAELDIHLRFECEVLGRKEQEQ
jgi:hypothetical protein